MEIITATMEHLNDVYKYICELENKELDKNDFLQIYQENINNNNIYYLLAIEKLNIIGFASLHIQKILHHTSKIGEIQEIIISKEQRGLGIGTLLLNRIKEIAVLNNCLQIEVCCNVVREKSHQFYLNQGMTKGHYKFTYLF